MILSSRIKREALLIEVVNCLKTPFPFRSFHSLDQSQFVLSLMANGKWQVANGKWLEFGVYDLNVTKPNFSGVAFVSRLVKNRAACAETLT